MGLWRRRSVRAFVPELDDEERVSDTGRRRDALQFTPAPRPYGKAGPDGQLGGLSWFGRFLYLAFIALMMLGFVLADAWTPEARYQAAGAITRTICAEHPQPHACTPQGHPSDFFDWLLRTFG